jgi:Protein of unknown function
MIFSNDDMDLQEKKSFITEHNSSFVVPSVEKKTIVFKIEDVEPPMSVNNQPIPLPENSNLPKVIDNILETLKTINPKFKSLAVSNVWSKYFETKECKGILSDMFWYCLITIDKRNNLKEYEKSLLDRISYNYIQLFVNVSRFDKEIFFENFYDCIAQGVFYSMFFSYPKSRSRLNSEEFKNKLFEIVSSKLTGINVSNQSYNNWILDLGAGNVLKKSTPRSQETSVTHDSAQSRIKKQTKRTLQQMRYSPLVTKYLYAKRYEAINSIPGWNMRYTLRNIEKEQELDRKYTYYKKLAIDTERNAKQRYREYKKISSEIDEVIKEEHKEFRKFEGKLEARTKQILKEGPSEFANKLVSLGILQREEKKTGYIDLFK